VTPAGHLLLAAPFLAITFWEQLRIMAPAIPPHAPQDPHEPFYALVAQLIGWSAIARKFLRSALRIAPGV
jgi:hypothetical protein